MALAGSMKLNHFLAIAGAVGVLGLSGLCAGTYWVGAKTQAAIEEARPEPAPITEAPEPGPAPVAGPAPAAPAGLSAMEQAAMGYQGRDIGSDKLKDVSKGQPYKINVYQDAGKSTANRLKIDLDRDDRWDEKWTFEPDAVTRQIAPADDENYTTTLRWDGAAWQ